MQAAGSAVNQKEDASFLSEIEFHSKNKNSLWMSRLALLFPFVIHARIRKRQVHLTSLLIILYEQ